MLEYVELKNFKCFEKLNVEFSNLNVLAGINSAGKSTFLQSLLLLRQAKELNCLADGIHLNGDIVEIGIGQDLLYDGSDEDVIEIAVTAGGREHRWRCAYKAESDYLSLIPPCPDEADFCKVNLFDSAFSYVAADRIGPRRIYKKSHHEVYDHHQVGYRGELFADYLAERGLNEQVTNTHVLRADRENPNLLYQAEGWLCEISPGINLEPVSYREAGLVSMGYRVNGSKSSHAYSPLNVGFGISFAAPVVLALLKAKSGDLIVLENPEAHLHPRGQRRMGELIALACAGGVQVVLETHSDHLLNGIRLAVKKRWIDQSRIRLNFFYTVQSGQKCVHTKSSPSILEDGSLSDWPEGFFDEWDKAIDELF